jgi:rare lipoprotein A
MRLILVVVCALLLEPVHAATNEVPTTGQASWYGESHRGKFMANGKKFDPDKLTAASWFYPFGTRVRVTLASTTREPQTSPPRSVVVTITDRGPARRLVREGRIIDLAEAAFAKLAPTRLGLIPIELSPVEDSPP